MHQLIVIALVILGLPLVSFLLIIFNQRTLNANRAHLVGLPILAFALVLSLYVAYMKLAGIPGTIDWSINWISFGNVPGIGPLAIRTGVMIDNLTAIMLVVVTLISFLVHLFSME